MNRQRRSSVPFWRAGPGRESAGAAILPAHVSGRDILVVLGLHWHTILGGDLAAQARRRARKAGATHWVHAGGRAESVGTIRLARRALGTGRLGIAREAHSGAQLFARRNASGIHAMVWHLKDGRCWLALVRDGQVLGNGDTVFATPNEAALALQAAYARFGAALQCTHEAAALLPHEQAPGFQVTADAPDLPALASAATAASALQKASLGGQRVLLPAAGLCAALAMVAWWRTTQTWTPPPSPVADNIPLAVIEADRVHRWQESIDAFLRDTRVPSHLSLEALWLAIGKLPLQPAGWLLDGAQCDAMSSADWHCVARYKRLNRLADNEGFMALVPAAWQVRWTSLDEVTASFALAGPAHGLDRAMPAPATPRRFFPDADVMQRIRAAFGRIDVGPAQPVSVPAPRDASGIDLPLSAGIVLPQQRLIELQGPLRSLALIGPSLTSRIAWTKLTLRIDPAAAVSLRSSVLHATLSGTSYEIHP